MLRRRFFTRLALASLVVLVAEVFAARITASKYDNATGLVVAPGYQIVIANCTACHSARIIIQQGMNRDNWRETIEWMQNEQGLWPISAPTLAEMLNYLATHYGPTRPHFSPTQP